MAVSAGDHSILMILWKKQGTVNSYPYSKADLSSSRTLLEPGGGEPGGGGPLSLV